MSNPARTYPSTCPACGGVKGYPTKVVTVKGVAARIVIQLSCHACQHQWDEIADIVTD